MSLAGFAHQALAQQVPVRALGRFDGWRENALVGYGIVTGLAGSGDSRNSAVTRQALRNVLSRLGTVVGEQDISSRNVAIVIVTANLPASANVGDKIDVTVSSIGDARSIAGGTLLLTSLEGPDRQAYALAQGPLIVGGYQFDENQNVAQRNHPTTGRVIGGASIERPVDARLVNTEGEIAFLLAQPNFETAQGIADAIDRRFGPGTARVKNADRVSIRAPDNRQTLPGFAATIEALEVRPARLYRVVMNERTGTIVAGGDVMISPVAMSQGDLRVTVETRNEGSQPYYTSSLANDVASLTITNTRIKVDGGNDDATIRMGAATIGDLIQALNTLHVGTRRTISILQALKSSGALHAELVIE
ncbi:MAG: flagellar basal body P-ring protein FlgI [Novosphingobium sp.]|uniref:flagellar basal body P-ring protein FlgI n=1 Tax=Novosphingobium sp. TaxID=1874826 RepID=UPI0032B7DC83